ncbi:hypothetical protein HGA91_02070 [candidate division WWE3 bacterium]|nr:hypothetical protein [candidate division WWE3 bacterium]
MFTNVNSNISYDLFGQGEINVDAWAAICAHHNIDPHQPVLMLPHGKTTTAGGQKISRILWEVRKLYFYQVVDTIGQLWSASRISTIDELPSGLPMTRIISFGECNVSCPYCKRDCQFRDDDGEVIVSILVPLSQVLAGCVGAHSRGEIVRFSGGDPVMFRRETEAIAEYLAAVHGTKVSIAHNGSGTSWVKRLLPNLSSAAIDLKAVPEKIGMVMGIKSEQGQAMYTRSLATQAVVSQGGALLDVRTPVFGTTSTDEMRRLAYDICRVNDLRYTFWTWRLYKAVQGCDWEVAEKDRVIEQMQRVSAEFPDLWLGIRAKWQRGGMEYLRAGRVIDHSADAEAGYDAEIGSGNQAILAPG